MPKNDRIFNISDAELIEHAETVVASLPSDIPVFTAFDRSITLECIPQIQGAIAESKVFPPDDVVIDQMAEATLVVDNALTACTEDYKTIAYFARKAFNGNTAIQNQFGMNDIEKARKSQPKMVVFMESLVKTAYKYQDQLVGAGCNPNLIEGLNAKVTALNTANIAQEKFKKDRAVITQDRTLKLNEVYRLLQPLHHAAVRIFANDPARLSRYTMPQPAGESGTTPEKPAEP